MHDLGEFQEMGEQETEQFLFDETEQEQETEGMLDEVQEMEFAAELLEIQDEEELENFLGNVFKSVAKGASNFIKSPTGKALGGILKQAAKKALPVVGGALGGFVGGPAGAALGSKLAPAAGRLFGLELEGLSAEDREFEVSRQFVRLASNAAKKASDLSSRMAPQQAARTAVIAAAKKYAPGFLKGGGVSMSTNGYTERPGSHGQRSGRWVRRGHKIILFGV